MSHWHWEAHSRYNMTRDQHEMVEDTIRCDVCLESWQLGHHDEISLVERVEAHLRDDHDDPDRDDSIFDIRERDIIGIETDYAASDCDGPISRHGTRRLPEGTTWSQYIGREFTIHPPEAISIRNDGLSFEWGGETDEGYSSQHITPIFRHESHKLDERDSQRDVFAESMGY